MFFVFFADPLAGLELLAAPSMQRGSSSAIIGISGWARTRNDLLSPFRSLERRHGASASLFISLSLHDEIFTFSLLQIFHLMKLHITMNTLLFYSVAFTSLLIGISKLNKS